MKPNKLTILISIALIATLILVILVRENQHNEAIVEYLDEENRQEDELTQSIKNFTELEKMYLELKQENIKLKEQPDIVWNTFEVTAYTKYDDGCNNITAIGLDLNDNWTGYFNFVAVDPDIIPYGKIVFIQLDGEIIEALAVDCGGKIKGNRLDLYCGNLVKAFDFGVKEDVPVGVIKSTNGN